MHALILGLLQQRVNPASITLHRAQAAEVPPHGAHHAGHARDRLEDGRAEHVLIRSHLAAIGGRRVEGYADDLEHGKGGLVAQLQGGRELVRGQRV